MSPKMPVHTASQAEAEMPMTRDPGEMIRMLEGSAETPSDWQEDFLLAVHGAPSDETTVTQQEENATNENTQLIQEFQVPVCQEFLPDGVVTVAFNDAWSQQQVSAPSVELFQDYSCPPQLQTAPSLYVVEGKEDPEDEGICIESPSPPTDESGLLLPQPSPSPVLAVSQVTPPPPPPSSISTITTLQPVQLFPTNITNNSSPPASPEKQFFERHNIMKWVIDDGDQSDIPELSHAPLSVSTARPQSGISGAPASQSSSSRQVRVISSPASSSKSRDTVLISPKPEIMDNNDNVKVEDNDSDWTPSPSPSTQKRFARKKLKLYSQLNDCFSRKRGRPVDVTPRKITAKLPRMRRKSSANSDSDFSFPGLAYQSDSASGLTDDEVSALKYRRMRDLNNEASRRCRENRKAKLGDAEAELEALRQKNITLKQNVHELETKVSRLKRKFLITVKQPSREIALARQRQLGQSLAISPDMVGTFMTSDSDIKPELDAFWSSSS